jgi:hypothetical protein
VTTSDAESFADLIADCADIPAALQAGDTALPGRRAALAWEVDDVTYAQVSGLEEYV